MADQATETMRVQATPEQCFDVVTDFEHYPEWAGFIRQVTVEKRDEDGRGVIVNYRTAAMGRSTSYTLLYDYSDAPHTLAWVLVNGDIMRKLDGSYVFKPREDGSTDVVYHLEADLKVPLPGFVKDRARGFILHTALKDLKGRVES
jgi:ribosome-associated toxin RatA of RatAB toxin-antitoxin module